MTWEKREMRVLERLYGTEPKLSKQIGRLGMSKSPIDRILDEFTAGRLQGDEAVARLGEIAGGEIEGERPVYGKHWRDCRIHEWEGMEEALVISPKPRVYEVVAAEHCRLCGTVRFPGTGHEPLRPKNHVYQGRN